MLERAGHTEAAYDLTRLAGTEPVGVLAEIVCDDGSVAKGRGVGRIRAHASPEKAFDRSAHSLATAPSTINANSGKERLSAARHNTTRDGMRHTLRVRQKLRRGDYRCVVVQPQLPREVRERFLGSGTRVVVIDPLGVSLAEDKNFYASLLRSVAEGFRKCLVS